MKCMNGEINNNAVATLQMVKHLILSTRRDLFQTQQLLVEINILNITQACTYPK